MTVTPKVELLAFTQLTPAIDQYMERDPEATDPEHLIEFAGRECYESFHKPNPKTQKNADYIERTFFEHEHGSITEHASATVRLTGVSRSLLTELTRHRHLSFSVRSQRFVNEGDVDVVIPPAIRDFGDGRSSESDYNNRLLQRAIERANHSAAVAYKEIEEILLKDFLDKGLPKFAARKQSREAARSVLPNMAETKMVVTGNFRAWHETLNRRMAPDADAEIREVALMIWNELTEASPVIFPALTLEK